MTHDPTLPNFEHVALEEAIAEADSLLTAHASEGPLLSDWVAETNAARDAAKAAYQAESITVDGVVLVPGETLVTLTIKEQWGSKPRRFINCVFIRQQVSSFRGYGAAQRERRLSFIKYGGSDGGGARSVSLAEESVLKVVPVSPVPSWIAAREERRKRLEAEKAARS